DRQRRRLCHGRWPVQGPANLRGGKNSLSCAWQREMGRGGGRSQLRQRNRRLSRSKDPLRQRNRRKLHVEIQDQRRRLVERPIEFCSAQPSHEKQGRIVVDWT